MNTSKLLPFNKSILGLAIAGCMSSQAVLAEQGDDAQTQDAQQLSETIVTATTTGIADTIITDEELNAMQADDLEDVFAIDPSVSVGGSVGVAQKIYVRGIEDSLLNVTIDGAKQSGHLFHHNGRITLEPELLKQVEVSAGAGEATNGAGALGGALRFVTKDPEDLLREGENAGALIKVGYFSNGDTLKTSATLFGRASDVLSGMLSYVKKSGDELESGNGDKLGGTDADAKIGFAKLVGHISDSQTLRLSYDSNEDKGERAQRPQWAPSPNNPLYQMKTERDTTTLSYHLNPENNDWVDTEFTAYETEQKLVQNNTQNPSPANPIPYQGRVETLGFDLKNTLTTGDHTITIGADYREDDNFAGFENNQEREQEQLKTTGVYLQNHYQATDKLLISAGLRYDDYDLDDNKIVDPRTGFTFKESLNFSESKVSPNIGFVYEATESLELYAGYAEALRGRELSDTFRISQKPNVPNLKAEEGDNFELGFDYEQDGLSVSAQFYKTRIENIIGDVDRQIQIPAPGGGFVTIPVVFSENVGTLRSQGFLASLGKDWGDYRGSVSYHRNQITLNDQDLNAYDHNGVGNSIGDTINTRLSYDILSNLELGWSGRFVKAIRNLETSAGDINKPGYGVHDFFANWNPTNDEDLTLTLTVKNAFDKQYIDHATNADFTDIPGFGIVQGLGEPGRDIRLGLSWRI